MTYLAVKVLHLSAVIIWLAGLLIQMIGLNITNKLTVNIDELKEQLFQLYYWDRKITLPAMVLVFLTGPYLAFSGHWVGQKWLMLKIPLVISLAALHGINAGKIRRFSSNSQLNKGLQIGPVFVFVFLSIMFIVSFVIFKP